MKNKIQQKIYAISQMLKAYASKLRISSFVGGQFKRWILIKLLGENFMIWNLKDYGDPLEKKPQTLQKPTDLVVTKIFGMNLLEIQKVNQQDWSFQMKYQIIKGN